MKHYEMQKESVVQRFCAPNDVNGNPRRVWIGYYPGSRPLAIAEDYSGKPQQFCALMEQVELPDIYISAAEYRRLLKAYGWRAWMSAAE